ncbi:polysaccharide deacetylase family protein [Janthinobacterium fluminis]|uniref:Polysaccharide deacetylase family protein n=1 Tax=Janthinobacterium fluminis TaxID=2987524 RepID=A0ABT5K4R0_9BURK|nr:polysaccharide deacetylase family protein [Janthinobacterium fluminis]MDC8759086.1 polysaccharide deacetylase family protein [Janthinobacterium fluminis]
MTETIKHTGPLLTLKIDVDTYRGTREGVGNLLRLLGAYQARATFLFSLGPDHTGWALRRALKPGFFSKVSRTSVVEHYGLKTLMYGTLLPGPDIGRQCAAEMRAARDAGFECGIHTWDHVLWQDNVAARGAAWTTAMMRKAAARHAEVFGAAAATHGAAGWQMNAAAFAEHDAAGYRYASDGRAPLEENGALRSAASGPHRLADGARVLSCVQLPTTLPTLDELLGREIDGTLITTANIAAHLLKLTAGAARDHVYTLHAELEGQKLAPIFEQLLAGWLAQGYRLASMADYYDKVKDADLPVCPISWGEVPGRSGQLMVQGKAR